MGSLCTDFLLKQKEIAGKTGYAELLSPLYLHKNSDTQKPEQTQIQHCHNMKGVQKGHTYNHKADKKSPFGTFFI